MFEHVSRFVLLVIVLLARVAVAAKLTIDPTCGSARAILATSNSTTVSRTFPLG